MSRPPKTVALSKKEIGQRVRALRVAQGMSQVQLAKRLDTYQTVISAVERGARGLSVQQIVRLADVLRVSPDAVLGKKAPPNGSGLKDRRFLRRLERIEKLSKRQKQALLVTLDNFLKGAGVS